MLQLNALKLIGQYLPVPVVLLTGMICFGTLHANGGYSHNAGNKYASGPFLKINTMPKVPV